MIRSYVTNQSTLQTKTHLKTTNLAYIGTLSFLTDSVKLETSQRLLHFLKPLALRRLLPQPSRLLHIRISPCERTHLWHSSWVKLAPFPFRLHQILLQGGTLHLRRQRQRIGPHRGRGRRDIPGVASDSET